jgi:peroxiredoxin
MLFPRYLIVIMLLMLAGCNDLNPSSSDERPVVDCGISGSGVCQVAPDFSLFDTLSNPVTMSAELVGADGIVLYFTMWCPQCNLHVDDMIADVIPNFPDVKFFLIDYNSGTITQAYITQNSYGYDSMTVLVDEIQHVYYLYKAAMGTTVVIDNAGIVQMNEDYKDGTKLTETLIALP